MRRILASTISVLALSATTAFAADIPARGPVYKAPAYIAPAFNWTGFYIGINGGYGWATSTWDGFGADAKPRGGLVGGTAGYNWQAPGSPWVFGIEGDVDWSDLRGRFSNALCVGCETRNSWLATVRGRVGYAFDRVLPYVTGGLALGDIQVNPPGFTGTNTTNAGWTVGGGLEVMLTQNWTAKVEYLHVDLGNTSCSAAACGLPTNVDFTSEIVRGGVNFKF